jgi:hypothetical protein
MAGWWRGRRLSSFLIPVRNWRRSLRLTINRVVFVAATTTTTPEPPSTFEFEDKDDNVNSRRAQSFLPSSTPQSATEVGMQPPPSKSDTLKELLRELSEKILFVYAGILRFNLFLSLLTVWEEIWLVTISVVAFLSISLNAGLLGWCCCACRCRLRSRRPFPPDLEGGVSYHVPGGREGGANIPLIDFHQHP